MASQVTNYKCPACTGPLHFVGASGKLECEYCGSAYDVAEIEALGVPVKLYQADVTKKEDCERMVTSFIADFGKIDVLVNNAGGALKIPDGYFDEMPLEYWDSQIALNLSSHAYCCHYAIKDMKAKGNTFPAGDGVSYTVQGSNNPKAAGENAKGVVPDTGAAMYVVAPADGTVTAVHVRKGDSVESGSPLVTIA